MKGSTAQIILKTLKGKRFEGFLAQIATAPKGDLLIQMCKYLHDTDEVTEADMRARFKLTSGKYFHWIEVIGNHLAAFWGSKKDEAQMEHTFQLAANLVEETEFVAASDLIKAGIKAAAQFELFDLVVRYWELAQSITPTPKIEGMDQYEARALRSNSIAFSDLLAHLEKAAQERNATVRNVAVTTILQSELMTRPENARSHRAAYYFWRIRSFAHSLLREYSKAIEAQDAILAILDAYSWLSADPEYAFAKETKILAQLLRLDKQEARFIKVSEAFHNNVFKSAHAEQEKTFLRFPAGIAMAIQLGDSEELISGITAFLDILESRRAAFPSKYITENLYCCLYGAIAVGRHDLWVRIIQKISGFGKPDFKLKFYPMLRFLEIIHSLEVFDWEDALRKIRNLRSSSGLEELQGMREVLSFLYANIANWSNGSLENALRLSQSSTAELLKITKNTDLVDYFDLPAWFDAIRCSCPMMDIFLQRAASQASE